MIASSLSKVKGTARWPPSCWNTTVSNWGKSTSFLPKNDPKECGRGNQDSLDKYTKRHDVSKSTEPTSCGARWAASWRARGLFHLTNAPVRHNGSNTNNSITAASANRLGVSLERLLDHLRVKTRTKTAKGKVKPLRLDG